MCIRDRYIGASIWGTVFVILGANQKMPVTVLYRGIRIPKRVDVKEELVE